MVRLFYYVYGLAAHSAFHLILWIMLCFKILPWMHLVNCTSINFATGMRNLASHISTLNVIGIGCKQLPAPAQHGALPASHQYPIFSTTNCIIFLHHLHYITSLYTRKFEIMFVTFPPAPLKSKTFRDIFQNLCKSISCEMGN